MRHLLSSAQMRDLDSRTIKEFGLPARVLMENAGRACAEAIIDHYPEKLAGVICVICGSGNNGGDGAVIARCFRNWGCEVLIIQTGKGSPSPEAQVNLALCEKLEIPILPISSTEELDLAKKIISNSSLVVDAIIGTGFKGALKPWLNEFFDLVNICAEFIVAVDIPSGLDADTGYCENSIEAEATIAVATMKTGHVTGRGKEVCGEIHWVDIGIPSLYYRDLKTVKLYQGSDFCPPPRLPEFHKNDFGKVYVFGGIPGYTGASVMAAHAALRAGCGYVYVLHRIELMAVYALKLTEALSLALPELPDSGEPDTQTLLHLLSDASAVLIGPGLGRDDYSLKLLETVLKNIEVPVVVDADGINLISENPDLYEYLSRPNILLTPHWGEFARLANIDKDDLEKDCLGTLRAFTRKHPTRILLKSHFSVYHDSEQTLVNTSGNDGLATGGSGDVLAGIIASFLAQNESIPDAAIKASYLLGQTAENLARKRGTASILPTDIIANLFLIDKEEQ
ncbi:MAG: NAD(P)H-hydrate dehydratase [Candidatus Cloacimonetes bacterium]|nr:NAD(P)H-hydrate dehydratase [Candidatus Cloacimonadota bacterium]